MMKKIDKLYFLLILLLVSTQKLAAQAPTITCFSPLRGLVGTSVTIIGTNFSTTTTNNIVIFGATCATVTAATVRQLTVLNTATSLLAYAASKFIPTFSPNKEDVATGDFEAKLDFATGTSPRSVAIGDLDGDGKPDLAVADNGSNTVSVFRNTGSNGNISYATKVDFATGTNPRSVAIGDMDGDGKADLVVPSRKINTTR